jgi:orotate phosphoribosyltransferase-like protein
MTAKEKIIQLFEQRKELTVTEITNELMVSKQMVHLVLNKLLAGNVVEKIGRTPKTIYRKIEKTKKATIAAPDIPEDQKQFLEDHFLLITEIGELLNGAPGFKNWCDKRNLPFEKTVREFIATQQKYSAYLDNNGLISGLKKIKNTKGYDKIFLDELLYLDFYAIERFEKTKLGTILHYAKQGQNKMLMKMLIDGIKPKINIIIKKYKIDAVAYVPPTIKRETQLMKVLASGLRIPLPQVEIQKISGIIPVPQKSLAKLEERIANAENTFAIKGMAQYKNLLLIDDAVGSGSTLNQIAGKIKARKIAKNIIGLAIVGSFKGFDVITDI